MIRMIAVAVGFTFAVLTAGAVPAQAQVQASDDEVVAAVTTRQELARRIRNKSAIRLLDYHVSGRYEPKSTAFKNMKHTARGYRAWRSYWGHYPNSRVYLKARMLRGMLKLRTRYGFRFRVTSIAGDRHSSTSLHYAGLAFDVDRINGHAVNSNHPRWGFRRACRELGADEVLGPGDYAHDTHIHCAWY